jgi:hypothetical protein
LHTSGTDTPARQYDPPRQLTHTDCPGCDVNEPAAHGDASSLPACEKKPAGVVYCTAVPYGQYEPAGHVVVAATPPAHTVPTGHGHGHVAPLGQNAPV